MRSYMVPLTVAPLPSVRSTTPRSYRRSVSWRSRRSSTLTERRAPADAPRGCRRRPRGTLAVGARLRLKQGSFLSHPHGNLAFCMSSFEVSHSLVGRVEWKDPIHDWPNNPRIDEATDLAYLISVGSTRYPAAAPGLAFRRSVPTPFFHSARR